MEKVGRPTVMTENVLRILEDAFSVGASDKEACFLANIAESSLYKYCEEHPEFSERKDALKKMPNYKAKKVIVQAIEDGDKQQANWWLERKGKDDGFSQRNELSGPDGKELPAPILNYVCSNNSDNQSNKS